LISVTVPIGRRGEEKRIDLDLDKVRGGDQAHARAALDPYLAIGVETCAPRAASASPEERAERVGGPILDARVDDVELEGEDVLEDVRAGRAR
jgi:hypothetical protein